METADTICEFWFGTDPTDPDLARARAGLWWQKDERIDRQIAARFESSVVRAAQGELEQWSATPVGTLALILLTDQFPRNIYRNTPQAFAYDAVARAWCIRGIESGIDRQLHPIERLFFYLPLEHSESLVDQDRSVRLFQSLADEATPSAQTTFEEFATFAIRHRDIILRFGRFPHRNSILGRVSSPAEVDFLKEPSSSF